MQISFKINDNMFKDSLRNADRFTCFPLKITRTGRYNTNENSKRRFSVTLI